MYWKKGCLAGTSLFIFNVRYLECHHSEKYFQKAKITSAYRPAGEFIGRPVRKLGNELEQWENYKKIWLHETLVRTYKRESYVMLNFKLLSRVILGKIF